MSHHICTNSRPRLCPWDAYVNGIVAKCDCCDDCHNNCLQDAGHPTQAQIMARIQEVAEKLHDPIEER